MASRLNLNLYRTHVRMIHDVASSEETKEVDSEVRQRWSSIVRETKRALAFDERRAASNGATKADEQKDTASGAAKAQREVGGE